MRKFKESLLIRLDGIEQQLASISKVLNIMTGSYYLVNGVRIDGQESTNIPEIQEEANKAREEYAAYQAERDKEEPDSETEE